jgi:Uma2 family endonuclease
MLAMYIKRARCCPKRTRYANALQNFIFAILGCSPSLINPNSTLQLTIDLTDEQFWQLCQKNQEWKFERTASGELLIMSPTGVETGNRNIEIAYQLQGWSRKNNLGKAFDSSTGFKLPNGADRSPDASWITIEMR